MKQFRYIDDVASLQLDSEKCCGCGVCETVCPHNVFIVENNKAKMIDYNGCMECGACANNCPTGALSVNPGVGCAAYVIQKWLMEIKGGSGPIKCC